MTSDISKKKKSKKQELQELAELQLPPHVILDVKPDVKPDTIPDTKPDTIPDVTPKTEDTIIEKPKKIKRIVKPRTEKQIESLAQGRLKRDQQQNERRKIKEQEDIILKQELEKKLIDKAIKVKKKQLKRIEIFDELSDDDIDIPTYKDKPLSCSGINALACPSQVIQKVKPIKPKLTVICPNFNPYDEFKKKYNIR